MNYDQYVTHETLGDLSLYRVLIFIIYMNLLMLLFV